MIFDVTYSKQLYMWTSPTTGLPEIGREVGIRDNDTFYFIHHPLDKQLILMKPSCDGIPTFVRFSEIQKAPMRAEAKA